MACILHLSLIHILNEQGEVVLADEMLTPDSSRFWPLDGYKPGQGPVSYTHLDVYKRQLAHLRSDLGGQARI